ncbi:poly(R)-hydroxyalkanoic acid synthase subunit PhaE [Pyxidicoccus trucidator]|uniref:poly(R)-hydroxyalkanoic acid synthase subunit PhaE n=1 Tax=Pyxidicoccus trucidator TaxID=2709662 RepID=UPI0013DB265A|nr:poly(R)-hydroxyalkanoic acid synthase subunit PhaE [Pyxidicoccus trucidator]
MSQSDPPAPNRGLLARGLKLLGHLTHPQTRTGKVFTRAEQGLTRVLAKVAESPTYLRVSGSLMRQGFNVRIRRRGLVERTLHTLRLPTPSEVEALRDQLRRVNDQVEALGIQLETVVDLVHPTEAPAPAPERPANETRELPARERAPSKRRA